MAIISKIWSWLGYKKKVTSVDIDKDIDGLLRYFEDVRHDVELLSKLFVKLTKLRKEGEVVSSHIQKENLRKQIELFDQLLLRFEYYNQDAQVNGIRVKNIAGEYQKSAKKEKMFALLDKMKRESRWFFDW